jgi:drug/metabolite transporter (DMT)-like permease
VALLIAGILAVTLPQTSGRATVPALLTGVAIATYSTVDRVGVRLAAPWLYAWLLVVLIAGGLVAARWASSRFRKQSSPPPISWRQGTVIGGFMWGGYLLVLIALSFAPLAVVAPVREVAIVAVAVWGVWKLRERRAASLKLSGAVATVVGVALIAL